MSSSQPFKPTDVTMLIEHAKAGDSAAADRLFVLVLDELKEIAGSKLRKENAGITLQATALVNEVWLKLIGNREEVAFQSRGHFFVAAAEAMRQILVDAARARRAAKRGGGFVRSSFEDLQIANLPPDNQILDLQEALEKFEKSYPMKAKLVSLRYFAGMTIKDSSEALSISHATAERYWAFARVWLQRELTRNSDC